MQRIDVKFYTLHYLTNQLTKTWVYRPTLFGYLFCINDFFIIRSIADFIKIYQLTTLFMVHLYPTNPFKNKFHILAYCQGLYGNMRFWMGRERPPVEPASRILWVWTLVAAVRLKGVDIGLGWLVDCLSSSAFFVTVVCFWVSDNAGHCCAFVRLFFFFPAFSSFVQVIGSSSFSVVGSSL